MNISNYEDYEVYNKAQKLRRFVDFVRSCPVNNDIQDEQDESGFFEEERFNDRDMAMLEADSREQIASNWGGV